MPLPPRTLNQLRTALAVREVSSRELTEQALEAATTSSEAATTFVTVHAVTARATADAIDTQRAAGLPLPPLAGIPISIKDLFGEAGQVTRAGSRVLADAAPAGEDSPVVRRLRAAGAVIVGRTNMTEFAYSGLGLNPHYGTPRNPWDRATGRIPGGSSSGAAVSVTDGMAAAAIGTDTGGSVRIPSAFCGLTGFKPTARRVPIDGVVPLAVSLDSVGPLARSVDCCALLDAVMAGEAPAAAPGPARAAPLNGKRLWVPRTLVFDGMDDAVGKAVEAALRRLGAAGARLVDCEIPEFDDLARINRLGGFAAAESWWWHARLIESRQPEYDPRVAGRIRRGASFLAADYLTLLDERRRWIAAVTERLDGDLMLMPTLPLVAPPIDALQASDDAYGATNMLILRNPSLINFLDGCAVSLPCHAPDAAPVGLTLAGCSGQDAAVLSTGASVESALARTH
jgi:aspartyl-tRNA(Asn)/glutamyl-tRNA(Gln) amidotransferase subunit A